MAVSNGRQALLKCELKVPIGNNVLELYPYFRVWCADRHIYICTKIGTYLYICTHMRYKYVQNTLSFYPSQFRVGAMLVRECTCLEGLHLSGKTAEVLVFKRQERLATHSTHQPPRSSDVYLAFATKLTVTWRFEKWVINYQGESSNIYQNSYNTSRKSIRPPLGRVTPSPQDIHLQPIKAGLGDDPIWFQKIGMHPTWLSIHYTPVN